MSALLVLLAMGVTAVESPHPAFVIDRERLEKAWILGMTWSSTSDERPSVEQATSVAPKAPSGFGQDRVQVAWKNPILVSFQEGAKKAIHPSPPDARFIDRVLSDYQDTVSFDLTLNVYPTRDSEGRNRPDRRDIEEDVKVSLEVDGNTYPCLQPWIKLDVKLMREFERNTKIVTYFDKTSTVRGGEVKTKDVVYYTTYQRYEGGASIQFDLNNPDGSPRIKPNTTQMAVIVDWGRKSYRATFDFKRWPAFLKQVDSFRP